MNLGVAMRSPGEDRSFDFALCAVITRSIIRKLLSPLLNVEGLGIGDNPAASDDFFIAPV
jgi:hypothetical protein